MSTENLEQEDQNRTTEPIIDIPGNEAPADPEQEIVSQGVHNYSAAETYVCPTDPAVLQQLEWFRDQKLALMMHFGLYCQPGMVASWALSDKDSDWSRHQVNWTDGETFKKQYFSLNRSFNPVRFQPEEWAQMAEDCGFRYLLLTTKHHDGFCLWDTKYTDYKTTAEDCPFHEHKNADIVKSMFDAFRAKGIGIGAPNGNYYSGTIEFAPNLPWKGVIPLAAMFEERLGIPTALTNDANAAGIGEMTYGAARGMKDFIMITLGTGVGSGIVINGQMVYGHDGFAGELGHTIIRRENGRLCGCGRHGCLETYCSATGVARTAREFLAARTDASLLRNIPAENITSKDVYDAAVQGDKLAQEIFEFTGNILGEALADAIAFSSPEAIVLFGGLAKSGDYIMKPIQKSIDDNILNIYKGKTKLLVSELKDSDAAVLGASALAWELKDLKE